MKQYLYLSVIPEALIVSMLPPISFGKYLAVGTQQRTRGQAIFFEVDPSFTSDSIPLRKAIERCVPHPDGRPKNSVYAAIYKVLEKVPLNMLRNLYLTTDDGRVLEIAQAEYKPDEGRLLHLYQEFCPVNPRVASRLNPISFARYITTPGEPISVPRIMFCELKLGELARDPEHGSVKDLPYPSVDHLRDCLAGLLKDPNKNAKTVVRSMPYEVLYRTVRDGFFVGDQDGLLYFPMPSKNELEDTYYTWWRSALMTFTH